GKLADLVLWKPQFFGAKPEMVIKGGVIVGAQMGDANASIPTPQPYFFRPMFGAFGSTVKNNSLAFVSKVAMNYVKERYDLVKKVAAVTNCRSIGKKDLVLNDVCPEIVVDPESYKVFANGVHLKCAPASELPLTQMYYLF
ncbi:MAG: urease subunit alpha, partial [Desulfomonilaceae bacterium]